MAPVDDPALNGDVDDCDSAFAESSGSEFDETDAPTNGAQFTSCMTL